MNISIQREKVLEEVSRIPDAELGNVFQLLRNYRMKATEKEVGDSSIMQFAGSWSDMSESDFNGLTSEMTIRRERAFQRRRSVEDGAS